MRTTIYRCGTNNGVATFLTQDAYDALVERKAYAEQHGIFPTDPTLFDRIMAGTFTITGTIEPYYRGYISGTYEDLDRWVEEGRVSLLNGESGNYVPFSNGDREGDERFMRTDAEIAQAFNLRPERVRLTPSAKDFADPRSEVLRIMTGGLL